MKLKVDNLCVSYGAIKAVRGVSFEVGDGEIVALIGANGAGKTSILRAVSGLELRTGSIQFDGKEIGKEKPHLIARGGIAHVPEGRRIFPELSVYDNLMIATYRNRSGHVEEHLKNVYRIFPRLEERKSQSAATLSGGEQQMLAVGRALMTDASLILLDEPSMGLAPLVVKDIFKVIREINEQGRTVLLVEQNAQMALKYSHRAYVLEIGEIKQSGYSKNLLRDSSIRAAYLGC